MRIALIYNEPLPSRYHALGEGKAVTSVLEAVEAVEGALEVKGHRVHRLGLRPPLSGALRCLEELAAELVFNLFEGFDGQPSSEWLMAGGLELLGRAYTGASPLTLALCLNKGRTKELLIAHHIPTPPYQILHPGNVAEFTLGFPAIVKPLQEDGSHGLSLASVVQDRPALVRQVQCVTEQYGGPVLVEAFLPGREFNAAILGCQAPRLLPTSEMVYSPHMPYPNILTYKAKWHYDTLEFRASTATCPAPIPEALQLEVQQLALAAHGVLGSPPYARLDMRADGQGRLHVLEVNPNPDLGPETGITLQAQAAGMEYGELVQTIVDLAMDREGGARATRGFHAPIGIAGTGGGSKSPGPAPGQDRSRGDLDGVSLRAMQPGDVAPLVRITADTGFFRLEEIAAAQEVLEECMAKGESSGYYVQAAEEFGRPLGFVCFGPTPLTRGTWDVYWIAVAPAHQGRGIGTRLLRLAEAEICRLGGRLVLVETSSQELYTPTRRFYCSSNYREVSRVADFYDLGDAKVIFAKKF